MKGRKITIMDIKPEHWVPPVVFAVPIIIVVLCTRWRKGRNRKKNHTDEETGDRPCQPCSWWPCSCWPCLCWPCSSWPCCACCNRPRRTSVDPLQHGSSKYPDEGTELLQYKGKVTPVGSLQQLGSSDHPAEYIRISIDPPHRSSEHPDVSRQETPKGPPVGSGLEEDNLVTHEAPQGRYNSIKLENEFSIPADETIIPKSTTAPEQEDLPAPAPKPLYPSLKRFELQKPEGTASSPPADDRDLHIRKKKNLEDPTDVGPSSSSVSQESPQTSDGLMETSSLKYGAHSTPAVCLEQSGTASSLSAHGQDPDFGKQRGSTDSTDVGPSGSGVLQESPQTPDGHMETSSPKLDFRPMPTEGLEQSGEKITTHKAPTASEPDLTASGPKPLYPSPERTKRHKTEGTAPSLPADDPDLHIRKRRKLEGPNLESPQTPDGLMDISSSKLDSHSISMEDWEKSEEIFQELGMDGYRHSKLSLKDVLNLGQENVQKIQCQTLQDVPMYFLRKLMSLSRNARDTTLQHQATNSDTDLNDWYLEEDSSSDCDDKFNSVHPLDVLCVLLRCSDPCLQQEILLKMSMCQYALPLLLPAGGGTGCTFMLWAMRAIVKRWRPQSSEDSKGFKEDNLVNISVPVFSFVRLGNCRTSKSRILNLLLSPAHQVQDFFLHREMETGNASRKISNGLVEICWYFPGSNLRSDIIKQPIAVTNMRGGLDTGEEQFRFLSHVSSAVFVFTERVGERECELLAKSKNLNDTYIIIDPSSQTSSEELKDYRKLLQEKLKLEKKNVWERKRSSNDAALVRELKNIIADHINKSTNRRNLEEMSQEAKEMDIHVDESSKELQAGKTRADQIATNIKDIVEYKKETMKLQGELWKELSKTEKEMCRMRDQGSENAENYIERLRQKCFSLREAQNEHDFPEGMEQFRKAVTELSEAEKQCFLKFTKFSLDSVARNNLCKLQAEYKETFGNYGADVEKLKQIDQRISDSSLGIEHFLRELGQFYEAKYVMENGSNMEGKFSKLPSIAADLLLQGFPLEFIDGDASNIPQQWISDVLSELDTKTGGKCRMRVITVLGVQSTGKSTLLNTMFGLQFPVASGRCTRGAFMTLIKVQDELQRELDCEFILVIDTEGLKSPELASLDDSYEHDNEMATLVVGLSDITIINMAMENTAEMKDILQLVIHAFLRMKQIGKKHNCQFVHQNVSDVSAHEKNLRDRQKLLQQLDKMTEIAARMEKKSQITTFSDIIDYNLEEHTWYIPGLWYGVPPMASVNAGYSDGVNELKKYLISYMKRMNVKAQTIPEYTEWIKSLWNAVKHEKFIFSFRNSLVSEAYNQLCMHYTGWEWNFQKAVYNWFTETETSIRNLMAEKLDTERKQIMQEMEQILRKEERNMSESLEDYFNSGCDNVHLLEPFRSDFFRSVKYLRKTQESALAKKCADALRLQEDRSKVQKIQEKFLQRIEHKVTAIIKDSRDSVDELNDHMLKKEFENMWEEALQGLNIQRLSQRNIDQEILHYLKNIYGPTHEKLHGLISLEDYYWDTDFDDPVINKCQNYITEIISTKVNYDETYCHDLLNMIEEEHKQKPVDTDVDNGLPPLDLVVIIFKEAAEKFQTLHNQFIETNDPARSLENLRSHYFSLFESMYKEKDECQKRARCFCEVCLKPAIIQHIQNHMGKELLDRILQKNPEFRTRKAFQFKVLQQLLKKNSFEEYNQYINNYKGFTQKWILNCIRGHYEKLKSGSDLYIKVLDSVMSKVKHASSKSAGQANNFSDFLDYFCRQLDKELVISQSNLKLIVFENKFNVSEFSNDVEIFLGETEKQIKAEMRNCDVETILSNVTMNPQEELYKKVIGCGKQCPFCKVPCEAGTDDHPKHFATIHRPIGLAQCNKDVAGVLDHSICSTTVVSNRPSSSVETSRSPHPYKDYQNDYPDWNIHPEDGSKGTDYWKFVLKEHNHEFAGMYKTQPAELPEDWKNINAKKALQSLKKSFNVKEGHSN